MSILTTEQVRTLTETALRDPAFRQALVENPRTAVHDRLGMAIPADKTLHVLQAQGQTVTVVIPPRPAAWPDNLSVEAAIERLQGEQPASEGKAQRTVEFQTHLIARAWQDEAFKQRLLRDPKGTVEEVLGVDLPAELTLHFVADDDAHQYLVLPPELAGVELTDEQLEQAAGGEVVVVTAISVVTLASSVGSMISVGVASTSW